MNLFYYVFESIIGSSIENFKEIPLTTENVNRLKSQKDTERIHQVRTYPDYKDYNGSIFLDKDNHVVGYVNVNKNTGMIQALEIAVAYRGRGLSKSLLHYAETKFNARQLTVNKKNKIALNLYKSNSSKIVGDTSSGKQFLMEK